jgi:hypothetical protein
MARPERPASKFVPVLLAVLICDTAATDPGSGKKSIIGVFDKVFAAFPTQRPLTIYVRLTDAEGFYSFKLKYVQAATGQTLAELDGQAEVKDRLGASDFYVTTPPLPIPAPGRYEIQVWFNDVFIGSTFLDAVSQADLIGKG